MTSNVVMLPPSRAERAYSGDANVGIIIQARMTSLRFPGKSLALLDGKPVVQHVIEQCKLIKGPAKLKKPIKIIVAVPDTPESEPLLNLVTGKLGVTNACGPEENVLERYYGAASHFDLDVIMRVTADCPLLNPKVASEVLQLLMWRKLDYTSNWHEGRTFPKGFDTEVFTYDCLEAAWISVENEYKRNKELEMQGKLLSFKAIYKTLNYCREHVTPWMIKTPGVRKGMIKKVKGNLSHINLCVDYPEDIPRLERYIQKERDKVTKLIISASNDNG